MVQCLGVCGGAVSWNFALYFSQLTMKQLLVILKSVLLLSTVIFYEVEGQVLISLRGIQYSNNTMVKAEDIGENDEALICSTDYRPCCGTPPNRFGEWYYPNGSSVRPIGDGNTLYRSRRDDGTVLLNRRNNNILPIDGRYRCMIPNNRHVMVNVYIYVLRESSIPRVIEHPQHSFNSDPGSTVSLSIMAINARVYQWQVNGTDIQESNKYKGTTTSTLVIQYIQEHDEGFYSCIVSSEFLTITSETAAVTVLNLPVIVTNPEDQLNVEDGTTVMFSVLVTGMRLSFNWMFQNGSQLLIDAKITGQNTSVLTIFFASEQDSGSYQCQVSNPAGIVVSQPARLSVFVYKQIETFEAIPGITSVLLTWSLAEDAQDAIDHFCLKYFPVLFPNIIVITNTTNTTYEAIGLIPRTTYLFELIPISKGDISIQDISIDVILDKPIPPVENVTVAVNSATSVHIRWNVKHKLLGWNYSQYTLYYSAQSPDGLHSVHQRFKLSDTSYNLTINHLVLEVDWQHHFEVSAVLVVGIEGLEVVESEKNGVSLNIESDGALFQLLVGPTDYCIQWNVEKTKRFQLAIRQKIASVISNVCNCNFPLNLIDDGVFSCRTFQKYVVYRSKITGLFASGLIQHLYEWVELNPSIQVDWLLLNIYSSCSVRINSIDDPDCSIPSNITECNNSD